MYERLDTVGLKSGEEVEMGVVRGPELEWADRVEALLAHKGEIWRWGNEKVLREDVGLEPYFYILHRDGVPFANMMNVEYRGVGIYGHVFTKPEDRRQGAASAIMSRLMDHFRTRGGKALFLGTGYDSPAYHIYSAYGFKSIEPRSGYMAFYTASQEAFEAAYFAPGKTRIDRLAPIHWPMSPALFSGDFPGVVRSAVMHQFGRGSTEGPMLPLLRDELEREMENRPVRTAVLVQPESGGMVGLATWGRDSLWPGTCLVDVYCHPGFWGRAGDLLGAIALPAESDRYVAYCDTTFAAKETVLEGAGFRKTAVHESRVAADREKTRFVDVGVWEKA